jgi:hypothetical protein
MRPRSRIARTTGAILITSGRVPTIASTWGGSFESMARIPPRIGVNQREVLMISWI